MISDIEITRDAAQFPIVSWSETRGVLSAGGAEERVECRIMKDADGELLFVVRGEKREGHDRYEEARPWRLLRGISILQADTLFATALERQVRQFLSRKSLGARVALDGGHVLTAEFIGRAPIHINETLAEAVTVKSLHADLRREFMDNRQRLVDTLCTSEAFRWPSDDNRVETYDPNRTNPKQRSWGILSFLDYGFAALLVLAFIGFVVWVAARLI